jgi:hypothetical protein
MSSSVTIDAAKQEVRILIPAAQSAGELSRLRIMEETDLQAYGLFFTL